uniref:Uncharacterized protein n=1 Tax=Bartonella schoenbuchensis (strain DSM 13525 / NCTC 13165 / R1) TaxID=687861 RepID=E6Z1H7_BARSR|nr:hypothetical protein BARSC_190238 [Bartonella schoenbuchensis R1]
MPSFQRWLESVGGVWLLEPMRVELMEPVGDIVDSTLNV